MKALLVNPSYPQTFWSLDEVLRMAGKKVVEPPLGLLTVAALLPKDWDLTLVELTVREISPQEWNETDIVMVSGMGVQSPAILEVIREGRRREKTVVVGGPWAFHFPEDALKAGADIVVKGEAEQSIAQLLEALERGESGIIIEARGWADLEDSPAPRYDLLAPEIYGALEIQFSRGCPYRCEFCDITLLQGRKVRTKSSLQILQELQNLYDLGWRGFVLFVDDNFIGNRSRAKSLLREMIPWMQERGYPFEFDTQASVDLAQDTELLNLMVHAGFSRVFLGIETPDTESLKLSKKYQNAAADLDRACETINRAGLQIIAGCIIGFDNERAGADQRLIDFAVRNQIPQMFATLLQVGPGTDLWNRMEAEGRLRWTGYDENLGNQTGLINFVPTRPLEEIVGEFIRLYDVLYDPEFFLDRTFKHFSKMKPSGIKKAFYPASYSELRALAVTMFRQGLMYSCRWKFWRYLFSALLKFERHRFELFLCTCVMGEHYYEFRRIIKQKLLARLSYESHRNSTEIAQPVAVKSSRVLPSAVEC
jgi:radical SAM superfamily enzyme YgiQ (UPF0313 family)